MEITSVSKYVKISADKARGLVRLLQGLPVAEALKITEFNEKKAAFLIGKTLKSAIANAQNNAKLSVNELRVKEAVVDEGPRGRRYWARARGMVRPIQRRTSHIRIVLTDEK